MTLTEETNSKAKSCLMGCGIAALVPVVLLLMFAIVVKINNMPPNIKLPTHSVPKDNAWDYFHRSSAMLSKCCARPGPLSNSNGPKGWDEAKCRDYINLVSPALVELRKGLKKPYMHPAVRAFSPDGTMKYNLVGLMGVRWALIDEAYCFELIGKPALAADSSVDCIELGVLLPKGAPLGSSLYAEATEEMGIKHSTKLIPKLKPSDLAHIAARLERIQKHRVSLSDMILEDGNVAAAFVMHVFKAPGVSSKLYNPKKWADLDTFWVDLTDIQRFCYVISNKGAYCREYLRFSQWFAKETTKTYIGKPPLYPTSNPILISENEGLCSVWRRDLRTRALFALFQTEVALRRYNADNSRYPDKLDLLVPKYLKSVPIDPLGVGKPLRYMPLKAGKSFKLYSLGPNLLDEGGKPPTKQDKESGDTMLGQED